ncbi:MAG: hypothetical protein QOK15_1026, partial [Nocardioidaceae bacterium]|nr:hypothetical protein [Nocardioidaceae bacterium]
AISKVVADQLGLGKETVRCWVNGPFTDERA